MVIRLQPDQVSSMWEAIKYGAIQANNVPVDRINSFTEDLLEKLLSGKAQAWLSYVVKENGEKDIHAIGVTAFMVDPIFRVEYLLAHSTYGYKKMSIEMLREAMSAMIEFAKANECFKFIAITPTERLTKMYEVLGLEEEIFVYSKTF